MRHFYIASAFLLLFTGVSTGQSLKTEPDSRLLSRYEKSYIDKLAQANPETIQYMNFELDNSYIITDFPPGKIETLPELYLLDKAAKAPVKQSLTDFDFNNIDIFKYSYQRGFDSRTYYRIGNTGKVIAFKSEKELVEKFNNRNK